MAVGPSSAPGFKPLNQHKVPGMCPVKLPLKSLADSMSFVRWSSSSASRLSSDSA